MALRCERCRTGDLTLESFGVYRCPNCGRVDADGNTLGDGVTTDRADSTQPTILETGRASFAAPPPVPGPGPGSGPAPYTSLTSAAPSASMHASRDLPQVFLATLAVTGLIDAAGALASHSACSLVSLLFFYGGLLTGKPWARTLSMAGAVLTIGVCAMGFVMIHGNPTVRIALGVVIMANAWWLYVLVRPDTVRYFAR